ncbi:MAG: hypothetical protein JNK30_18830 [Phenylobacterium sp.]|uniref:hypothetical protein n=1 Tax=Phenylobacterium sp. TaxID=1871053 RepID=UPI001A598541|nr:hypothetical protein [Phenylobacterium sp.]MBL8773447.1 hypothetical protein [Phenylobacterium sp.]
MRRMTAAPPDIDIEAALARIAACDLAGAEEAHARMMAAESAAEFSDLGRTYQRLARSLRQSLALKARLAREAEAAARERLLDVARRTARGRELEGRLGAAVVVCAEPHEREAALAALAREVEIESERPDFLTADIEALVADICARLPLDEPKVDAVDRVSHVMGKGLWPHQAAWPSEEVTPAGMSSAAPRPGAPDTG